MESGSSATASEKMRCKDEEIEIVLEGQLCNNFQAATCRPRQTTEWRLAPLYDKS